MGGAPTGAPIPLLTMQEDGTVPRSPGRNARPPSRPSMGCSYPCMESIFMPYLTTKKGLPNDLKRNSA